ncbi:MAG: hypothetical protein PHT27_08375, partial [Candidatus Izemoplasmatales bacterium]|nr:hypothetical protein [Candidatus Izemoplasmatales bacterium]
MRGASLIAFFPLVVLIAIPFLLRPAGERDIFENAPEKIVIITPHTESVRNEFSRAFREYYKRKHGSDIAVEWRNVGGTSDIVRFIADRFEVQRKNGSFSPDANIGIDLFFGGGQFDHNR